MSFASGSEHHSHRPTCSWRDALLIACACALGVMLAFGIKVNNHVEHRERQACKNRRAIAIQGNRSASDRKNLKAAVQEFLTETRRVRSNRHGTSYDPEFVRVIDRRIEPRLQKVRPIFVSPPSDC